MSDFVELLSRYIDAVEHEPGAECDEYCAGRNSVARELRDLVRQSDPRD